ncbi:MAG TPA: YqgE/AlgH family protein [Bryobacteraceae bacterium]
MNVRGGALAGVAALLLAALLDAGVCRAQSQLPADLAQGKILVSPRDSPDPHFANSVILLARYSRTGALGLMLQYKSDLSLKKVPSLQNAGKRTDPVFIGGPVELPSVLLLERSETEPPGAALKVTGNLYLLAADTAIVSALHDKLASDLRVFIGYSGWGPGQLENEVRHKGWFIFDYDETAVFDPHPETLWERMVEKTGRSVARLH